MKLSQMLYDSFEYNNIYKKISDTQKHRKKLDDIKHRKNQFVDDIYYKGAGKTVTSPNKRNFVQQYERQLKIDKENRILGDKIDRIVKKGPTPFELNQVFIKREAQNKLNSSVLKRIKENEIKEQNFDLFKRIQAKTSFIKAKDLDTKYSTEHLKTVDKMRKVKKLASLNYDENFVLPLITVHSSHIPGLTLSDSKKENKEKI